MVLSARLRRARMGLAKRRRAAAQPAARDPLAPAPTRFDARAAAGRVLRATPWAARQALGGLLVALKTLRAALPALVGGAILLGAAALIHRALMRPTIDIAPIPAPRELTEKGLTPDAAARRLQQAVAQILADAGATKRGARIAAAVEPPGVSAPEASPSIDDAVARVRGFFGVGARWSVAGDITAEGDGYALNLKIARDGEPGARSSVATADARRLGDLFAASARNVLEAADPYALAASSLDDDPDRATRIAQGIIARQPADPAAKWAYIAIAHVLCARGKIAEASIEYNKALGLDPGFADAWSGLGYTRFAEKRFDEAVAAYNKALELDPRLAVPHNGLGLILRGQGKAGKAFAEFGKAIDRDPEDADARTNLGDLLHERGDDTQAMAEFSKAIAMAPRAAAPHYNLALILKGRGEIEAAIVEYNRALALDPKDAATRNNLGDALLTRGRADEAAAELAKAVALDPQKPVYHRNLGVAYERQHRFADARAEYDKADKLEARGETKAR